MPKYLVMASYNAEGAKGVLKDGGTKRRQVAEAALKSVGGKVEAFYFAFGEHDLYAIIDAPITCRLRPLAHDHAGAG